MSTRSLESAERTITRLGGATRDGGVYIIKKQMGLAGWAAADYLKAEGRAVSNQSTPRLDGYHRDTGFAPPPKDRGIKREALPFEPLPCECYATIFERLKFQVEEHLAEQKEINAALKSGSSDSRLLRRAVSLSRRRERMSDVAGFLTSVHNERPYVAAQ